MNRRRSIAISAAAAVLLAAVVVLLARDDDGSSKVRAAGDGSTTSSSTTTSTEVTTTTTTSTTPAAAAPTTTRAPTPTPTTTTGPPPVCTAADINVVVGVSPTSAGPGEPIQLHIAATNRSGRTCLAHEKASWPRWDVNIDRPPSADSIWGYGICQGQKDGNRHLATADADVPWPAGTVRTAEATWDQKTCAGAQAPPGTYRVKAYWTPAAEQAVSFSPDVALTLHS